MKEVSTPVSDEKDIPAIGESTLSNVAEEPEDDMFSDTEIELEEVSIDGICGVY